VRQPLAGSGVGDVSKDKLLQILKKLLDCDLDLAFLLQIDDKHLEQLVVAVRVGMEREKRPDYRETLL
jgi:hypothetical protein